MAAFEFQAFYHPSWVPYIPNALDDISSHNANWVVLTPSWSYTRLDPPVLELVAGQDALWAEMITMVDQAKSRGLQVALRPVPRFPTAIDAWWSGAQRDFPWWVSWFDQYRAFVLHHADLAARSGAQTLVLGGRWMAPALPEGKLTDGSSSNVPQDANDRYKELVAEVRDHFDGAIAWALPYSASIGSPPTFLNKVDQIYILWSIPLSNDPQASTESLQAEAERIMSEDIQALRESWNPGSEDKPIIISLAYPSVEGAFTNCLPDPIVECLPAYALSYPAPDVPLLNLDFTSQVKVYDAVLAAVNQHSWIKGFVSQGYYPPATLHDKSTSVHGKPAAKVLQRWFEGFLIK
jgi:hypothetical protein